MLVPMYVLAPSVLVVLAGLFFGMKMYFPYRRRQKYVREFIERLFRDGAISRISVYKRKGGEVAEIADKYGVIYNYFNNPFLLEMERGSSGSEFETFKKMFYHISNGEIIRAVNALAWSKDFETDVHFAEPGDKRGYERWLKFNPIQYLVPSSATRATS